MKYDFVSIIDRQGKDAMAVDVVGKFSGFELPQEGFDFIPMCRYEFCNSTYSSEKDFRKN